MTTPYSSANHNNRIIQSCELGINEINIVSQICYLNDKTYIIHSLHIVYKKCVLPTELGSVVRTAIRQGGVTSLWQGLGPSLLRDVPFSGKNNFRVIIRFISLVLIHCKPMALIIGDLKYSLF